MWSGENKVWIHYRKDIIAADVSTAMFLSACLRQMMYDKTYIHHLEVIDLQRYKLLSDFKKVKNALAERMEVPFVFVCCKN